MRITNRVLVRGYLSDLTTNLQNMRKLQEQLSSGKEIRRPSDDPFRVARTMELTSGISLNDRYKKNIEEGLGWLETTETAIGQMGDVLHRIRELTVQAGNATYNEGQRTPILMEVEQLKEQLMQIGNTAFDGRYIFGGDKTTNKPFEEDLNAIIYSGSTEGLIREFSQGVRFDIGFPGEKFKEIFTNKPINLPVEGIKSDGTSPFGGGGVLSGYFVGSTEKNFTIMVDEVNAGGQVTKVKYSTDGVNFSEVTASIDPTTGNSIIKFPDNEGLTFTLSKNTDNTVGNSYKFNLKPDNVVDNIIGLLGENKSPSSLLDKLDEQIDNLLNIRSEVGSKAQRLEAMQEKNTEETFNMTELLSKTSDIDVAEKTMQYKVMESVYMASLMTGAKIIQPSLLDFLR